MRVAQGVVFALFALQSAQGWAKPLDYVSEGANPLELEKDPLNPEGFSPEEPAEAAAEAAADVQPPLAPPPPDAPVAPVVMIPPSPAHEPWADPKTLDFSYYSNSPLVKKHVDFWIQIYSKYTTQQGLIHDSKYIDKIYEVLDFKDMSRREAKRLIKESKRKWARLLESVHRKRNKPDSLTAEEQRVFQMYSDIDETNKFVAASRNKRMRFQLGQRDRFIEGIVNSGPYLPMMEQAFKEDGMPLELTRLPFVESSFNIHARSKVGASGVWQFIRSTGRLHLKINHAVDERNDPYLATHAAAKLLRQNFESLRSWPLAVVAYNHGRKGMMRAVRRVGSLDVSDIVQRYRSRSFGFASQNFFMEFLAAREVEKHHERYFGKIERAPEFKFVEVGVADFISPKILTKYLGLDLALFKLLNPGFTSAVYKGQAYIPAGSKLRIPSDWGKEQGGPREAFWTGYLKIPAAYKYRKQVGGGYDRNRRLSYR